jgi:hypothetical protein
LDGLCHENRFEINSLTCCLLAATLIVCLSVENENREK